MHVDCPGGMGGPHSPTGSVSESIPGFIGVVESVSGFDSGVLEPVSGFDSRVLVSPRFFGSVVSFEGGAFTWPGMVMFGSPLVAEPSVTSKPWSADSANGKRSSKKQIAISKISGKNCRRK